MSDNFLSRWSKRKLEAREQEASKTINPPLLGEQNVALEPAGTVSEIKEPETLGASKATELPDVPLPTEADLLAVEQGGNIRAFMADKVSTELRNKAFKALFSRPEFNVMDGLDIYIDDYNKFTPLSQEDIGKMTFSKQLLSRPDLELPSIGDVNERLDALTPPMTESDQATPFVVDDQQENAEVETLDSLEAENARVIPDGAQALDSEHKPAEQSFEKTPGKL